MNIRLTIGLVLSIVLPVFVVLGSVPSEASKNFSRYATTRAIAAQGETIRTLRKKRSTAKSVAVKQSPTKQAKAKKPKTDAAATVSDLRADEPVSEPKNAIGVEQTVAIRPQTTIQRPSISDQTWKMEPIAEEAHEKVVPPKIETQPPTEEATALEEEKQRLAAETQEIQQNIVEAKQRLAIEVARQAEDEKRAQLEAEEQRLAEEHRRSAQVIPEMGAQASVHQTGSQRIASVERPEKSASAKAGTIGSPEISNKCKKAKSALEQYAFSNIEIKNCKGKIFEFSAERDGKGFAIKVSAATGELIEVAKSPEADGQKVP